MDLFGPAGVVAKIKDNKLMRKKDSSMLISNTPEYFKDLFQADVSFLKKKSTIGNLELNPQDNGSEID